MSIARALFQVDLIAGLAAVAWGCVALYQEPFAAEVSAKAAFSFAFVALMRGLNSARTALEATKDDQ